MNAISTTSRKQHGFSLIELMAVIGIIVMLAGLLIAALPGIQNRINRQKVETFIGELEGGLSRYQLDNGIYPPNPGASNRDAAGLLGAPILYRYLSGDFDADGTVDENEEIYVPKLDYDSNKNSRSPRSTAYQGSFAVIDSYNAPIRYMCDPPNTKASDRKTYNPTYDIWSIVDTDPTQANDFSVQSNYITNWQSK